MKMYFSLLLLLVFSSCGGSKSGGNSSKINPNGRQNTNQVAPIENCQNLNNCQATIIDFPPVLKFNVKLPNNTTATYDIKIFRKEGSGEDLLGSIYCGNGVCNYTPFSSFFPLTGTNDSQNISNLILQYTEGIWDYNQQFFHLNIVKR